MKRVALDLVVLQLEAWNLLLLAERVLGCERLDAQCSAELLFAHRLSEAPRLESLWWSSSEIQPEKHPKAQPKKQPQHPPSARFLHRLHLRGASLPLYFQGQVDFICLPLSALHPLPPLLQATHAWKAAQAVVFYQDGLHLLLDTPLLLDQLSLGSANN